MFLCSIHENLSKSTLQAKWFKCTGTLCIEQRTREDALVATDICILNLSNKLQGRLLLTEGNNVQNTPFNRIWIAMTGRNAAETQRKAAWGDVILKSE